MASSPLGSVLELIIYVISDSVRFLLDVFAKILGVVNSFLPGFSIGGIPFIIIAIVIIGAIMYFFGQHVLGTGRNILVLLFIGALIGFALIILL